MRAPLLRLVVISLLCMPVGMRAQVVRGTVSDATGAPVSGAVVQLLDSTAYVVSRQLSAERGTFRVAARTGGSYRLKTLRIGFAPTVSEPFVLTAGSEMTRNIT